MKEKDEIIKSWSTFIDDAERNIIPIYQHHEMTFDQWGIHSRLHVTRAVFYAEYMGRTYTSLGLDIDFTAIRYATIFHDSGRKANGKDYWEADSANLCTRYLESRFDHDYAYLVGQLIEKGNGGWEITKRIMHDADTLEIMRPTCGHGGLSGFRDHNLRFAGERDPNAHLFVEPTNLRKELIEEAWNFILLSENYVAHLGGFQDYIKTLLNLLRTNSINFPHLSVICEDL